MRSRTGVAVVATRTLGAGETLLGVAVDRTVGGRVEIRGAEPVLRLVGWEIKKVNIISAPLGLRLSYSWSERYLITAGSRLAPAPLIRLPACPTIQAHV